MCCILISSEFVKAPRARQCGGYSPSHSPVFLGAHCPPPAANGSVQWPSCGDHRLANTAWFVYKHASVCLAAAMILFSMYTAVMNEDSSTVPLPPQSHDLLLRSHDLEQLSEDMLLCMQLEQVSPEQYCHSVIAAVTSLLLGYLSKHTPQLKGEVESSKSDSSCRPLSVYIAICLQLLAAVINLLEQLRRHTRTPQLSQKNTTLVRTHTQTNT